MKWIAKKGRRAKIPDAQDALVLGAMVGVAEDFVGWYAALAGIAPEAPKVAADPQTGIVRVWPPQEVTSYVQLFPTAEKAAEFFLLERYCIGGMFDVFRPDDSVADLMGPLIGYHDSAIRRDFGVAPPVIAEPFWIKPVK